MNFIKCPLNYTGGKFKLLSTIMPVFPKDIDTFVDLFAGGFNVGINVTAQRYICNDHISYLIELYQYFKDIDIDELLEKISTRIKEFDLTLTNSDGYNELREVYNEEKDILDLFILTCFSFNHQIRFNNNHKFNCPFGKERSSYNPKIEENLIKFCKQLKKNNIVFSDKDFLNVDLSMLGSNDLVYCDPPYLISNGSYNDGTRGFKDWGTKEEEELLSLLDNLDSQNVKFALSNVLYHKELSNDLLINWSKKYNILYIDQTYSNCNYQFKKKNAKTVEVLITNYDYKIEENLCEQLTLF